MLEVQRKTQALTLQTLQHQGDSEQTGPYAVRTDRRDAEIRSTASSEKSSQARTSQEQATIKSKRSRSQTASLRSLSPQRGYPPGISVPDTVSTAKTVKLMPAPKKGG